MKKKINCFIDRVTILSIFCILLVITSILTNIILTKNNTKNSLKANLATINYLSIDNNFDTYNTQLAQKDILVDGNVLDMYWSLVVNKGVLTISGNVDMPNLGKSKFPWEEYKTNITQVIINSGVKSISNYAFYDFKNLKTISISNTVTTIGAYAFGNDINLNNVVLPKNVAKIGSFCFSGCSNMTSLTILAKNINIDILELNQLSSKNSINLETLKIYDNYLPKILLNKNLSFFYYTFGNPNTTVIYSYSSSNLKEYTSLCGYSFKDIS